MNDTTDSDGSEWEPGSRRWYCKTCRRFTDWEFRSHGDAEDERCKECLPESATDLSAGSTE